MRMGQWITVTEFALMLAVNVTVNVAVNVAVVVLTVRAGRTWRRAAEKWEEAATNWRRLAEIRGDRLHDRGEQQ